jgi:acyl-CoA hydrolase
MPRTLGADEAAALLRPSDVIATGLGPSEPTSLLEALGRRDDWKDLTVAAGLLTHLFSVFAQPGVQLRSAFFGPVERALAAAGHRVEFVPGDFRRFKLFAEKLSPRVMATLTRPPDAEGRLNLSLHAGATVAELRRCGRDPNRLLIVETTPHLPRTLGLPPEHTHCLELDEVDVLIEGDRRPIALPDIEPSPAERAIAEHAGRFVHDGTTLQTGIGGVPTAVAALLAEGDGGDYGIHTEMFTTGLMRLHQAGKVSNAHKGIYEGFSAATFAMGSEELYTWLDERDDVRFLPVERINEPSIIAANRNMISINGALSVDLYGQVVADAIDGRQHSGIGGHEDFTSGASLESDDRSLICLPATVRPDGRVQSRIVARHPEGTVVTTPRHQVDVVVTEHGAAEVAGLTVRERARALARIAAPEFRDALLEEAEGV